MQNKPIKLIYLNIFLLVQLINTFFVNIRPAYADEDFIPKIEVNRKTSIEKNNFYILGPGDVIEIIVLRQINEYNNNPVLSDLNRIVTIDNRGFINLSRLDRFYVQGLTLNELKKTLNAEYKQYLKEPRVEIFLKQYRPVEVFVDGAVETPGLHVVSIGEKNINTSFENLSSEQNSIVLNRNKEFFHFPTIFDAIKLSGGVTPYADLTNVEVTRIDSLSNGGGRIKTKLNLIDAIELIDTSQNIKLMDGDTIFIPKSNKIVLSQLTKAKKANFNPKFIKVFVGGRVRMAGTKKVNKMSVLNDAIYIAGGAKYIKGPVRFLRYNSDGSTEKRVFKYQKNAERGDYFNPYLKDGDIIFVGDSVVNITSDVVGEITAPLKGIFAPYLFYKVIKD